MGWFDKKSWQLRRKIRDLQSELAAAEREGKYVVEQGLFFAELHEMGEATLMVLGTADHLDSEEDRVIRNFFDRNGFTVENLRLDKSQKTLAAVEIIPPEELTKHVAKTLKHEGYRLVDDSDQERSSSVTDKRITLSGLIRAISALFATHVHKLIINTPIKMNMEGNRLLHWMPLVRDALVGKAGADVVSVCREPFVAAYNHYYGQLGQMENPEALQDFAEESMVEGINLLEPTAPEGTTTGQSTKDQSSASPTAGQWNEAPDAHPDDRPFGARAKTAANSDRETTASRGKPITAPVSTAASHADREASAAYATAAIYKSLIGASDQRRMRNAEVALDIIARFFGAKSACLIFRADEKLPFAIHSNSPGPRCLDATNEGIVCTNAELLQNACAKAGITILAATNGSHAPQAVIAPLDWDGNGEALIFLAAPENFSGDAHGYDAGYFAALAKVFCEYPDLLLAEKMQKGETPGN